MWAGGACRAGRFAGFRQISNSPHSLSNTMAVLSYFSRDKIYLDESPVGFGRRNLAPEGCNHSRNIGGRPRFISEFLGPYLQNYDFSLLADSQDGLQKVTRLMETVVLFGGTGFIGTHLAQHLLRNNLAETIFLVDINGPRDFSYTQMLQSGLRSGKVHFVAHDVRKPIPSGLLPDRADLIFNLAAVHREPGHRPEEYFETNLLGAENVCVWAGTVGCETLVFTSSISPYGSSEERRTETSLPAPETPYGSSKLAAEQINMDWHASQKGRKLLILRPGVVFGPGEGGNVTRLVRSVVRGYFVYMGNRKTVKAAGYVKELCLVTMFGLEALRDTDSNRLLINFTMNPPPTIEQMVDTVLKVIGKTRRPLNLPRNLLLGLSYPVLAVERLFKVELPINPVRVRKLVRSNNIYPEQLRTLGYDYSYTLESAFRDWQRDMPSDFSA
jgi:GlcNAc-P-P-Und epimerase